MKTQVYTEMYQFYRSTGLYDVVKLDWLEECLVCKRYSFCLDIGTISLFSQAEKQCVPFVPTLMFHISAATKKKFAELYDKVQYDDSSMMVHGWTLYIQCVLFYIV